jgi:transglutaminase/protease-like cytokinesis protein 3
MSIELSRDELLEIRIALSRALDYSNRHDDALSKIAVELKAVQYQANTNTERLDQEVRARSKSDLRLEALPHLLSQALTDIAVLKENEERASSRFNMIAAAFWAAIAVAVIAMFQAAGNDSSKPKSSALAAPHRFDHLANRPAFQIPPNPKPR